MKDGQHFQHWMSPDATIQEPSPIKSGPSWIFDDLQEANVH